MRPTRPTDLGPKARRLWKYVTDTYVLRGDELRILEECARTVDLIEDMLAAIKEDGLRATGSRGQPVPHPFVQEVRQHRLALTRMLAALKLTDAEIEAAGNSRAASARAAANSRWKRAS